MTDNTKYLVLKSFPGMQFHAQQYAPSRGRKIMAAVVLDEDMPFSQSTILILSPPAGNKNVSPDFFPLRFIDALFFQR